MDIEVFYYLVLKEDSHKHSIPLKYQAIVKNGQLKLPTLNLLEGTIEYLLSTSVNREHLKEAIASLKNPDNYIYIDSAKL